MLILSLYLEKVMPLRWLQTWHCTFLSHTAMQHSMGIAHYPCRYDIVHQLGGRHHHFQWCRLVAYIRPHDSPERHLYHQRTQGCINRTSGRLTRTGRILQRSIAPISTTAMGQCRSRTDSPPKNKQDQRAGRLPNNIARHMATQALYYWQEV